MIVYNYTGYVNRELKEIIFGGIFQGEFFKADASGRDLLCWQRGQGNFELAANSGYDSRGSADPRESLRKRRILKIALTAHKVLQQTVRSAFWLFTGCNCGGRKVNSPPCQGHFELV